MLPNNSVGQQNLSRWIRGSSQQAEDAPDLPPVDHVSRRGTDFALANMADRFIAVTGGGGSDSTNAVSVRDVHRFDIQGNSWEKLPDLNIPRHAHASTSVDGNLYVFCGLSVTQQGEDAISTIEVLDDACSALDLISMWRVITLAPSVLAPRFYTAVAQVNEDQIAIIGGLGFDEAGDLGVMGDVVVFDAVA